MSDLLETFGLRRSSPELDKPLRVRVSEDTLNELDALEVFLQGHGFPSVSRSTLVRAALTSYLDGVREEVPEALIATTSRVTPR